MSVGWGDDMAAASGPAAGTGAAPSAPHGHRPGALFEADGFERMQIGDDPPFWVKILPGGGEILAEHYASPAGRTPAGWAVSRWCFSFEKMEEYWVQLQGLSSEQAAVLFSPILPDPEENDLRGDDLPLTAHELAAVLHRYR